MCERVRVALGRSVRIACDWHELRMNRDVTETVGITGGIWRLSASLPGDSGVFISSWIKKGHFEGIVVAVNKIAFECFDWSEVTRAVNKADGCQWEIPHLLHKHKYYTESEMGINWTFDISGLSIPSNVGFSLVVVQWETPSSDFAWGYLTVCVNDISQHNKINFAMVLTSQTCDNKPRSLV